MKATGQDGASVSMPPPLVYLAAVIAGALVHRYLFSLSLDLPRGVRFAAGAVVAAIGFGVMAGAVRSFRRTGHPQIQGFIRVQGVPLRSYILLMIKKL